MAIDLSARARLLIQKRNLEPNLILEIDGVSDIYGAIDIFEVGYLDAGLFLDDGLFLDSLAPSPNSKPYISLGSSGTRISQQLLQDKGGTQSITTFRVDLIDKNEEITRLITPGEVIDEILGTKARLYINYNGGSHPEDSVLVHRGIISNVESAAATVSLTIDSPERQKHQEIFIVQTTKLNGAITNSDTTITVDSTDNFLLPANSGTLRTYIQIEDEIIEYTGKTSTTFTGCVRGQAGTVADSHDDNTEISSLVRLQGNCIDLALKLMLSQADDIENEIVQEFQPGGIIRFDYYNIQEKLGVVVGDFITTTGATNGANNLTLEPITGFGVDDLGSWIETGAATVLELGTSATADFRSKYNVLSDGLGMQTTDVDIARHESLQTTFSTTIPDYDFWLKDTVKPNEFLNEQLYFPAGLYSLPRKSKASVGITVPPLADQQVVTLDETNVVKPGSLKSQRSTNKNFYNAVVFRYEKDPVDDRYLVGKINYSATSQSRIKNTGVKPLTVPADGLRDGAATDVLLRNLQRRILERYEFAAEAYPGVKLLGKTGITIEVGDVVVFGSSDLKLSDTKSGTRNFIPKLYEVVNKDLNVKDQSVSVDLLSTNFELDGRYGIVSPSTIIGSGSTTTEIIITDSYSTAAPNIEQDKWTPYIGEKILVHSVDYTFAETVTLVGFDASDDYKMIVSPALSAPPSAGYVIDAPNYDSGTDPSVQAKWKLIHCFFDPQVPVVSGVSATQFNVSLGNAAKFTVGSIIRVHNYDYSVDSPEVVVSAIAGTLITVDQSLGFTPSSSEYVDLIGFLDGGLPYRFI